MNPIKCETPEDLVQWGEDFSHTLQEGDVILVDGPMGAGKTTLAQGIARGLGIKQSITSPSFTKHNAYVNQAAWTFHHLDLYNVNDLEELQELGIYEIIEPEQGVCYVEWWKRFPDLFRGVYHMLEIQITPDGRSLSYEKREA